MSTTSHEPTVRTDPATRLARLLRHPSALVENVLGSLATASLSLVGVVLVTRLWHASWSAPWQTSGDANLMAMTVRNMQRTGWFQTSDLLNAPLGQDMRGYPSALGDLWNALGLKVLSLALPPAVVLNVAYLMTFVLVAVSAYLCLRLLRVPFWFAVALGATYSWLPYHFLRGIGHLYLSDYAAVPIACILALAVLRKDLGRWLVARRSRLVLATLGAIVIGGTGLYYAVFTIALLGTAAVIALLRGRWRPALLAVGFGTASAAVLAASAIPTLLYRASGGVVAVEGRSYAATEYYGLKITNLLLPLGDHRVPALAALRDATGTSYIPGEGSEMLGLIAGTGFVLAALAVLAVRNDGGLWRRLRPLGSVAVMAVLWSTVAGLNGVLAATGLAQLRAWNRMSVVIGFAAIAATGLTMTALARAARRRVSWSEPVRTVAVMGVAGLVAVVGLLDQTNDDLIPDYPRIQNEWASDEAYFTEVEARLGTGAALFQLPVVPFPENPPVHHMVDYQHLRGYLHSDLAWSYGGVKGTDADWQQATMSAGVTGALPSIVAAGFTAVYVDRDGYDDRGRAVERELQDATGEEPFVDGSGDLAVYDLRDYAARLAAQGLVPDREDALTPTRLVPGEGMYLPEQGGGSTFRWLAARSHATVLNPADEPRTMVLRATLRAASPSASVTITLGDQEHRFTLDEGRLDVEMTFEAQPGKTPLVIATNSESTPTTPGDARDLRLQAMDLVLVPQP